MNYSDQQLESFERIVREGSQTLSIENYVSPDALIISDGEHTIRVSKGKKENQALFEIDGYTNTITTSEDNREKAIETALRQLCEAYESDLRKTALDL